MVILSKVKIDVLLKENNDIKIDLVCSGILVDNIIKYNDGIVNVYNIDENVLTRKTSEYEIVLDFDNEKGIYKFQNLEMPLSLKVLSYEITDCNIYVKYKLNENVYEYKVRYEVL